jgi:hypothetical protein
VISSKVDIHPKNKGNAHRHYQGLNTHVHTSIANFAMNQRLLDLLVSLKLLKVETFWMASVVLVSNLGSGRVSDHGEDV